MGDAYAAPRRVDREDMAPDVLEPFADAAWWCCHVEEEIELRPLAFRGFDAAGETRRAA